MKLTNLTHLNLDGHRKENAFVRGYVLLSLTNLTSLSLRGNTTVTDGILTQLVTLKKLSLSGNPEIRESSLLILTSLKTLILTGHVKKLTYWTFGKMTSLERISLVNFPTTFDTATMTQIKSLSLCNSTCVSKHEFTKLQSLTKLTLRERTNIKLYSINQLTNLTKLRVSRTYYNSYARFDVTCPKTEIFG